MPRQYGNGHPSKNLDVDPGRKLLRFPHFSHPKMGQKVKIISQAEKLGEKKSSSSQLKYFVLLGSKYVWFGSLQFVF